MGAAVENPSPWASLNYVTLAASESCSYTSSFHPTDIAQDREIYIFEMDSEAASVA